ncbi:ESX secretion-associated protein EspG [Amycolatopsis anabasis]|uniref:ESX secretion-associated protein EspG n=1 Tax=Amycolatopsis anabasis TaxID=1840409 RepID=UPI00131D5B11|nr:ESX secretion-associated protein EspG [Amycolatopsis anabasis]
MVRRTATDSGVVLSHLEFDVLWEDLDAGEQPYPLEVASHGVTIAERDELAQGVYAGLEADEDLDDEIGELLFPLADPDFSVDMQLVTTECLQILAVSRGNSGVLAVRSEAEVVLEPLRGEGVLTAVAGLMGELPPGPGEPVSMPRAAYAEALDGFARAGYSGFENALASGGVTGRAVRAVATLVESPRTAAGQLAANGPRERSEVLNWFDTEAGRYLVTVQQGAEQWVTIEPAHPRRLQHRIAELLDSVTG